MLLVDLDPMASLTIGLGHEPQREPMSADVVTLDQLPGVRLARGGPGMRDAARWAVDDWLGDLEADVRILDIPPHGISTLALSAVSVADLVLVPIGASTLDMPAVWEVVGVAESLPNQPALRVLLTRVHGRRLITERVRAHLDAEMPGAVLPEQVPEDARATEWAEHEVPVTMSAPRSRAAQAYRALARRIAHQIPL